MVLMIGITLFEFYLAAVVVLEFLCGANRHLLEVKEALWDRNSTDIRFILKYSILCILVLSNTFLITPTKCTILLHCICLPCVFHMSQCYHHRWELCVICLKPHAVTQLLSMASTIVTSEILVWKVQLAFTEVTITYTVVDHRYCTTVLYVKNLKIYEKNLLYITATHRLT